MRIIGAVTALLLLAGCAAQTAPSAPATGESFTGEVWTWDERQSIVTLRQFDGTMVRVKTTPDQIARLQLNQRATLRGELAPPAELKLVVPAEPMTAVPRGAVEQSELTGAVSMVDSAGRLSITSPRGPLHVWGASGVEQRFRPGQNVRVRVAVQAVDMVPTRTRPAAPPEATKPGPEPGDYATVTGRVIGVNADGGLVVESPTGPIQVYVSDTGRYRVSDTVQVRTSVHPVE